MKIQSELDVSTAQGERCWGIAETQRKLIWYNQSLDHCNDGLIKYNWPVTQFEVHFVINKTNLIDSVVWAAYGDSLYINILLSSVPQ